MDRKMRVLCFHPALAPYRLDYFNLLARRVDLTVVFMERNVPVQRFDQTALMRKAKFKHEYLSSGINVLGRSIRMGVLSKIRKYRPHVVIGYDASPLTMTLALYKILFRATFKLYTATDDSALQIESRRGVRKMVRDFVFRHLDGIIVTSDEVATTIRRAITLSKGCRLPIVPIVHDTLEMRRHEADVVDMGRAWRKKHVPDQSRMILFVGRLTPIKNLPWLIQQFVHLPLSHDVKLVLVGEGAEEPKLKQIVDNLGLSERVLFAGRSEGDMLYGIMSTADALVLCSKSETYGAVVPEAMQWGVPCIVSDRCGSKTLIREGVNGSVFRYNDSNAFQDSVEKVMGIPRSDVSILPVDLSSAVDNLASDLEM